MNPNRTDRKRGSDSLFVTPDLDNGGGETSSTSVALDVVEPTSTIPTAPASPPPPISTTTTTTAPEPPDPFDPVRLRLKQNFASAVGVRKIFNMVPFTKPKSEWWVRTHPDPAYRLETAVVELREDRETYIVAPELWEALSTEPMFSTCLILTAMNRQGVVFLWGLKLPGPDGKPNPWHVSALDAAKRAEKSWIRMSANMSLGGYDVWEAPAQFAEPNWPTTPFRDILETAFRDKLISTWDHPILRQLRGEA